MVEVVRSSSDSQTSGKLNDRHPVPTKNFVKSIYARARSRVVDKRIYTVNSRGREWENRITINNNNTQ